jgi:hypothetical protein
MFSGQESELCHMIIDCCAQQRTYEKYFGLIGQRLCQVPYRHGLCTFLLNRCFFLASSYSPGGRFNDFSKYFFGGFFFFFRTCSTTGKPTRSFATERVSLDSV